MIFRVTKMARLYSWKEALWCLFITHNAFTKRSTTMVCNLHLVVTILYYHYWEKVSTIILIYSNTYIATFFQIMDTYASMYHYSDLIDILDGHLDNASIRLIGMTVGLTLKNVAFRMESIFWHVKMKRKTRNQAIGLTLFWKWWDTSFVKTLSDAKRS